MFELLVILGLAASCAGVLSWIRRVGRAARAEAGRIEEQPARTEYARRLLKHVERKQIADLAEGQAGVIRGRARAIAGVPLIATCQSAAGAIAVNSRLLASLGDELSDEWSCVDFELVDATGVIRVQGAGVDVAIVRDAVQVQPPTIVAGRLVEGVILPDTEILVLGMVSVDAAATDYRDGEQLRVLRVTEAFPVAVSNDADLFEPGEKVFTMEDVINRKRG